MTNKVVITGMGIVSPLGEGAAKNWENLIGPSSGLLPPSSSEGLQRAQQLVEKACAEAYQQATLQDVDPERIGCTVSASKPFFASPQPSPLGRGRSEATGEACSVIAPDVINQFVGKHLSLKGESRNVIAACATGAYSIALAASWIEQGICDVVLAGSVEPYPHPLIEAGFRQMGVMSPESVTRPFDRHRSGFAFGEGAGIIVLESESHASRRHVKALAHLSGWALGSDSHSAVAFNSNGGKIAGVIARTLARANLRPQDISHVNAHGTGTRLNDWIETQALIKAFGSHAEKLMISATKASTGHLLGASGSVEFILTTLALRHQFIPPTEMLETPDPECSLDYTPKQGHLASFDHALSLSFGFGGPIGALAVSRC